MNPVSVVPNDRRHFLGQCLVNLGSLALLSLLQSERLRAGGPGGRARGLPHHTPRAKNVIFLFMAGGPSQFELLDNKPLLGKLEGQKAPASVASEQRFAFLKPDARLLGPRAAFQRHGQSGLEISDLLPHLAGIADEITLVRSMTHDVFNHAPAQMYFSSSGREPGRPAMGSWVLYGLGSEAQNLPGFVVLQSGLRGPDAGSNLYSNGFLPAEYQGVALNTAGPPILDLQNPPGINSRRQGQAIEAIAALNSRRHQLTGDPNITARTASYELACRMQTSAPELIDFRDETVQTRALYGVEESGKPSFARNCLLARRLVERGVRFVQLIHKDWDHHGNAGLTLERDLPRMCQETDRPAAALVRDLKQRGLLDQTLVLWAGEFGRTPLGEIRVFTGRDHHPYAFSLWMAGGGLKRGYVHGTTDDLGFQVEENPVSVQDLQATILHLLGLNHLELTYRFQGRDFRLTDVEGTVVEQLLA